MFYRLDKKNCIYTFSIYRAQTLAEAEEKFECFSQRLPVFVIVVKEMFNVQGLQKLCDCLIENPSWSLAHLIAYFNLTEHILHEKVVELIDYPDHKSYMSPFQLAVKTGNIEMAKVLLPLSKLEHLDNNSNSIYHYAAPTTKEMINVSFFLNSVPPPLIDFFFSFLPQKVQLT